MPGPIGLRSPIDSGVRQSRRVAAAAVCAIAFASVQCGQVSDRRAVEGSTITILYPIDERGLGPMGGEASQFLVFLPLVIRNHDGQLEGRLARRWEHSPDYREWTIHLRTDVRWHDGVAVTAHDIKFTLDLFKHPEVHWALPDAYTVTILNDSTYTINYKRAPGRPLDYHGTPLAYWTVYYPKHLLENLDPKEFRNWEFWKHPVGNGPYRYLRTVPKTLIEVEANPDYYRGVPKIERVILKFGLPSLTELLSGNVDALVNANRVDILKLAADPRFRIYHYCVGRSGDCGLLEPAPPTFP